MIYVTADRQRVVREGDPEAAFGIAECDIDRLGLRPALEASQAEQSAPAPATPKRLAKPADKAVRVRSDK